MDEQDNIVSDAAVQYKRHDGTPGGKTPLIEKGKLYTYDDYASWPEDFRCELIDGVPYLMGAPTGPHQSILGELHLQLGNYLKGKTCKVFVAPFDVMLNAGKGDNTVVQPDIVIVCDRSKLRKSGCYGTPDMAIEIISPSTAQHDTLRKLHLYEKYAVREYWIINPEYKTLNAHILRDGKYVIYAYGENDNVPVGILDDCTIDLSEAFASAADFDADS